jgi:hypothetical protein
VQTYPSELGREVGALLKGGLLGFSIEGPGEMGDIILDSGGSQITAPLELCAVAAVPLPEYETCYVKGTQPFRPKCDTGDEVEMLLLFTLPEAEKRGLQCPNLNAWATSQRQVGQ